MALLGHVSAEMSLRYGRLFDTTVRDRIRTRPRPWPSSASAPCPPAAPACPWPTSPAAPTGRTPRCIKSRLAGGFCLRAPAQGACTYANICEHCPSFHTDASSLPVLAAQRVDAQALAQDAEERGWITEAARHRKLIARLDTLISKAQAG